ncbi:MAG: hypothetical protein JWR12_619 [Mucilaginibacter sp.]|nr:hypothetical protein [Mucilaginibacter sp.]
MTENNIETSIDDIFFEKNVAIGETIKSLKKIALVSMVIGCLLLISGIILTSAAYCCDKKCEYFVPFCFFGNIVDIKLIFYLLPEIGGVILLIVYKSNLKQISICRNEQIVLRNLNLSWKICKEIPDKCFEDKKTNEEEKETSATVKYKGPRIKIMEQIIETLLRRCS